MGNSKREVVATRDCNGSLFQQYKEAIAFIYSRLNKFFTIKDAGSREEQLEIPIEAIREIVINATVHNSLKKLDVLFYRKDELKLHDVMAHFSVSRASASRLLSKLVKQGDIERIGKGPATRFKKI